MIYIYAIYVARHIYVGVQFHMFIYIGAYIKTYVYIGSFHVGNNLVSIIHIIATKDLYIYNFSTRCNCLLVLD